MQKPEEAQASSGLCIPQQSGAGTQSRNSLPLRQSAAPKCSAPPPPTPQRSGGVSRGKGESKEGLGGNRNPPGPPWPPEAATRLLTQPKAAQERAAKPQGNARTQSSIQTLCPNGRVPHKNATAATYNQNRPDIKSRRLSCCLMSLAYAAGSVTASTASQVRVSPV